MSVMLNEWTGPCGGVPPWHVVAPAEFVHAFDCAIDAAQRDIEAIADNAEAPTFTNTVVALETTGATLDRVSVLFSVHSSNLNVGPIPEIERIVNPKLAEFQDRVTQNKKLFERIEKVYESRESFDLAPAQLRLLEDRYKQFVRQGAKLRQSQKEQLSSINQELAGLFTKFSQNVLADEESCITWICDEERLSGLPRNLIESMATAGRDHGNDGQWAVVNTRSSMEPFLTYAHDRPLREQVWRTYYSRGDNGDDHDNNEIITKILSLRAERADLLGYPTHAHWRLERSMAKTPGNAMDLMMDIWPRAVQRVREEVADMQSIADADGNAVTIQPWDYRYYAERVRKQKYDLDFNEVKPYLQLDRLREAMMWVADDLFGLEFNERTELPVYHADVRVWEVSRGGNGPIGLWYFDPFARVGKRSGAWMSSYRSQENITSPVLPIVSNNSNFVSANDGSPVLISWDDAETLFHEFGHAIHGLLSNVNYPSQSGTSVVRDYVEFPSQLMEHWLSTPEVLSRFAVHFETGEPIPDHLVRKIERAESFNQGFGTVEFLASAIMDMRLHLEGSTEINPRSFEQDTLKELGMPREIVMRHRTPQFAHVFSGDGYSAGYYSYLWADALTADAAEAFSSSGSFYDVEIARRLHDNVLSVGDTIDPAEGYRAFRGRDVDPNALLRKRGFLTDIDR